MFNNRLIRLASVLLGLVLVVAACGDDDTSATTEATTTTAAPTTTTEAPAPMDIVDTAVAAGTFETLVAAVQAADLVDTLKGEGPFTVFAPTDEAFAAALEALDLTADELLASEDLRDILLYHVVPGAVFAETVVTLDSATTAQGSDITIEIVDGGVVLNGTVNVTTTDIEASNGVIHVIDFVLLPPAGDDMGDDMGEDMEAMDIVDTAIAAGSFDTLVAAVQAAELVDTLKGEGPFTVFAPTDEAFAAALEALDLTADELLASEDLRDILLYHVVPGAVYAETVVTLDSATTAQGSDITIEVTDEGVLLNGTVLVTMTDIEASNGVIHVIDFVLLPPAA